MHDKDPKVAAMALALAASCEDLEPGLPFTYQIVEKGQRSPYQPAQASSPSANSSRSSSYLRWTRDKMPSLRRLAVAVVMVAFLTVAYASVPVYRRARDSPSGAKASSFQELLNSVSDASLHEVLINVYEKYRHGVFPEDRTAMQAVHDDNAAVATSLVELARRQNPNITAVTTVPASSTATVVVVPTTETNTVVQTSGTDTVVIVNTQTTVTPVQTMAPADTPVQTTALQVSSNPPPGPSSSVPVPVQNSVPVQSVNSSPLPGPSTPAPVSPSPSIQANPTSQANPSSSQAPPAQSTAGSSGGGGGGGSGTTTGKATAAPSSPAATTLVKTSSATFTSTSTGQGGGPQSGGAGAVTTKGSSTQQIVYTTTLPNGSQSTVTSYTVIPAGEQASTPGISGSTVTGTPSLQNGAVEGTQPRGMGLVGSLAAALIFVVGIL